MSRDIERVLEPGKEYVFGRQHPQSLFFMGTAPESRVIGSGGMIPTAIFLSKPLSDPLKEGEEVQVYQINLANLGIEGTNRITILNSYEVAYLSVGDYSELVQRLDELRRFKSTTPGLTPGQDYSPMQNLRIAAPQGDEE